jgi:predicted acetyltransferase
VRIINETSRHHKGWFRALEVEGEKVSWLNVFDYRMRIGGAVVSMGGIAGVATSSRHRMKGYSRMLMEDSTAFMKEKGHDCALLFGIENFYHKFDYAPCMAETTAKVRTRDAEGALGEARGFRVRPLVEADAAAFARLYNRAEASRTLTLVREAGPVRFRHGSEWRREADLVAVEGDKGGLAGYFIHDAFPAPTTVCEVQASTGDAWPSILDEIVRIAIERRDGEITLRLPADHAFLSFLRRFGLVVETRYRTTGGAMGRIIDQDAFLAKLEAAYCNERGKGAASRFRVTIETDLGRTRVAVPGRKPAGKAALEIPQAVLFQAVTGFREPAEVLASPGVSGGAAALRLLEFLRPGGVPHMYSVDHF